ncbi:MAG: GNAT family N-acetyltransferase [Rhodobacteraceae bacterium]|nr:GNAT family N-acetyltransferase [Paracoccaceae bacterium]
MTAEELAALHAISFAVPRPWTAAEFDEVLATRGAFLLEEGRAFLVGRTVADEAELLTLAVPPELRRHGLGRRLLRAFHARALARGAEEAFLEVAEDNAAARALYRAEGWAEVGRRPGYHAPGIAALLMRRDLRPA